MEWGEFQAELRNKIRWSIGTSLAGQAEIHIPYAQQMAMALWCTNDVVSVLKQKEEKPDLGISRESLKAALAKK